MSHDTEDFQHIRKAQSEICDHLHHLPPFSVRAYSAHERAASDVEDHVFSFTLYVLQRLILSIV